MEENVMSAVTSAVGTALELVGTMLTTITSNPVLCTILAFGFVGLALKALRRIKRSAA